jgi:putative transposase
LIKEYPPCKTVYSFYKRAKDKLIWEKILRDLVLESRLKMGRKGDLSYSLIDSQSVKDTGKAEEQDIDGEKKVKGSKRHIVTDTQKKHLLHVKVHAANTHDTVAGCCVFEEDVKKNIQLLKVYVLTLVTARPWKNL